MDMPNNSEPILTGLMAALFVVWSKIKMVSKSELERHEDVCGGRNRAHFDLIHEKQAKTLEKVNDVEKTLVAHMAKVDQYILMSEKRDIRHAIDHPPKGHFGGIESD